MNGHKNAHFFMMVKKSVLAKLSDRELEKYLELNNRFVPEAVKMAFQILEERGRIFSTDEKVNIQNIIQNKIDAEQAQKQEEHEDLTDHFTTDSSAIRLYSRTLILTSSLFLGTLYGATLLALNFIKLQKYTRAIFTLSFGFIYVLFQYFAYQFVVENNLTTSSRYSPEILPIVIGPALLILIWVTSELKRLPYRSESYLIPILLAIVILVIIVTNYNGWFSSYFLMQILDR